MIYCCTNIGSLYGIEVTFQTKTTIVKSGKNDKAMIHSQKNVYSFRLIDFSVSHRFLVWFNLN
jgi:hypothetical protein